MMIDLTKEACENILASNCYGHLGCSDGDEPYVVPITYVYQSGVFYGYTHEGQKIDIMRKHPTVCVQVERVVSGQEWESVMCWGLFEPVTDPKTMQDVKLLFAEQYGKAVLAKEVTPVSPLIENLHLPTEDTGAMLYRMKPYRMTGKAERN